ncbi:hypothetical protein [Agromyces sp. GXS1127]|uniref:hypothetical protein n=1 Tax=Agromyces sp. GXS1127 TaxID=3424181 RepID=UPI003D30FFA8
MTRPDAERLGELQRLAFGRGSTETERMSAAAQLHAMQSGAVEGDGTEHPRVLAEDGAPPVPAPSATVDGGNGAPVDPPARAAWITSRSAILAGLALAVGIVLGWQVSGSVARANPGAKADTATDVSEVRLEYFAIPVRDTAVWVIMERESREGDPTLRSDGPFDPQIDPASVLFLQERADGVRLFGARTADGDNLCMIVELADSSAASCTSDGTMPEGGLSIVGVFEQPYGGIGATWRPDGTSSLE